TEKTLTEQPHLGSVMAKVRPATRNVPSYVWLQDLDADARTYYLHGGILGETYAPMLVGKRLDNPSAPRFRVTAFDPQPDVAAKRLRQRYELLKAIQVNPRQTTSPSVVSAMEKYQERALDLVTRPESRRAFDLEYEPVQVRDRYGRHPLGQNLL